MKIYRFPAYANNKGADQLPISILCRPITPFNRGIKHNFPFINTRKVLREVLKTEGEAKGFQPSRGTLQMLMNDKIINSTNTLQK